MTIAVIGSATQGENKSLKKHPKACVTPDTRPASTIKPSSFKHTTLMLPNGKTSKKALLQLK